ncbi:hypothetical protein ZWY2020_029640 [Hordeum vulgare]|nr:hypothetical protein ZWY2020_029640 [Hordeum vulgare]
MPAEDAATTDTGVAALGPDFSGRTGSMRGQSHQPAAASSTTNLLPWPQPPPTPAPRRHEVQPTPKDAVDFYLRRRVLGQPLPDTAGLIHEARVYGSEPGDLAAAFPRLPGTHERFFFTTCKRQKAGRGHKISRTAGAGGWTSNGKKVIENNAGEKIGFRENRRYSYKDESRESDWLMEEYHICGLDQFAVVDGEERVLCKVYVSPGLKPGSVTPSNLKQGIVFLLEVELPEHMPRWPCSSKRLDHHKNHGNRT